MAFGLCTLGWYGLFSLSFSECMNKSGIMPEFRKFREAEKKSLQVSSRCAASMCRRVL